MPQTIDNTGAERRSWNDSELVLGGDTRIYRQLADVIGIDDQIRIPATGTTPATTSTPKSLRIGSSYATHLQGGWDGNVHTGLFQNAYFEPGAPSVSPKWVSTHGSFGSRGIVFSFSAGISLYADAVATTADSAFTPTERFRVGNDGKVVVVSGGNKDQLNFGSTTFGTGITWGADAAANLYRSAAATLKMDGLLEANQPICRVRRAGDQPINNNTLTTLLWDTDEIDSHGLHDTSTNTAYITVQKAGYYLVAAAVQWASGTTGSRALVLRKTGAILDIAQSAANMIFTPWLSSWGLAFFNVGDQLSVDVQHTQTTTINVVGGAAATYLALYYLRS